VGKQKERPLASIFDYYIMWGSKKNVPLLPKTMWQTPLLQRSLAPLTTFQTPVIFDYYIMWGSKKNVPLLPKERPLASILYHVGKQKERPLASNIMWGSKKNVPLLPLLPLASKRTSPCLPGISRITVRVWPSQPISAPRASPILLL
jgi:hypothetical protein